LSKINLLILYNEGEDVAKTHPYTLSDLTHTTKHTVTNCQLVTSCCPLYINFKHQTSLNLLQSFCSFYLEGFNSAWLGEPIISLPKRSSNIIYPTAQAINKHNQSSSLSTLYLLGHSKWFVTTASQVKWHCNLDITPERNNIM